MRERTEAHRLFEAYLGENHVADAEHEPDLGASARPSYRLVLDGCTCLCQIVELTPTRKSVPRSGTATSMDAIVEPIRAKVDAGARQLRPATELGHALVVVLIDSQAGSPILNDEEIISALSGDPRAPAAQRNGELRQVHPHVSAVVAMHPRPAQPERAFAHAFVPNSGRAAPLPGVFFRGPHDQLWEYSADQQGYAVVHDHGLDA
jgi:hypothetical protein